MAGPVVATCAARGLGSVSVAIFARRGFQVTAATGRHQEADDVKRPGARGIVARAELAGAGKPLGKERCAGGIDTAGSTTLANVLSMTRCGGTVAAGGLAGGMDLPTSAARFILVVLRSSALILSCVRWRNGRRRASVWRAGKLAAMTSEIGLAEVSGAAREIVEGHVRGRIVVRVG